MKFVSTIGTRKIYDELIAKGVSESELTGLFAQISVWRKYEDMASGQKLLVPGYIKK